MYFFQNRLKKMKKKSDNKDTYNIQNLLAIGKKSLKNRSLVDLQYCVSFQVYSKVMQLYTYIYMFPDFFLFWVISSY